MTHSTSGRRAQRAIRIVAIGSLALTVVISLIAMIALRDNYARPASGERRIARSQGVSIHYFASGAAEDAAVLMLRLAAADLVD